MEFCVGGGVVLLFFKTVLSYSHFTSFGENFHILEYDFGEGDYIGE